MKSMSPHTHTNFGHSESFCKNSKIFFGFDLGRGRGQETEEGGKETKFFLMNLGTNIFFSDKEEEME